MEPTNQCELSQIQEVSDQSQNFSQTPEFVFAIPQVPSNDINDNADQSQHFVPTSFSFQMFNPSMNVQHDDDAAPEMQNNQKIEAKRARSRSQSRKRAQRSNSKARNQNQAKSRARSTTRDTSKVRSKSRSKSSNRNSSAKRNNSRRR